MPEPPLSRIARRQTWLEPLSDFVQKAVGGFYKSLGTPGRFLKSSLNGTYLLRHPLHPLLTDIPIGAWAVGLILDYTAHFTNRIPEAAGDVALIIGLIAAVLTLATGYTDFQDTIDSERRFGCLHGLLMSVVVLIYAASLGLRWWAGEGVHPLAVGLSTAGFAILAIGAWYGGHVVFGTGYAVNREAFLDGPTDWAAAGRASDVPAQGMHLVEAGGMKVLMTRADGRICAISAVCSHAGGPLDEGSIENGVVTCPWHGSRFRVRDGRAVSGPATFDVPRLVVRDTDGALEVRLETPLH